MYISKKKHIYTEPTENTPTPVESLPESTLRSMRENVTLQPERDDLPDAYAEQMPPTEQREFGGEILVPKNPQDLGDMDKDDSKGESFAEFEAENTDTGILKIQASSGNSSIPFVNVNILVYKDFEDGRHTFFSGATNSDGVINDIILPAPPRINSEEGNGSPPYASYSILATREGLVDETVENVPIFSGVKSIQPITMSSAGEV